MSRPSSGSSFGLPPTPPSARTSARRLVTGRIFVSPVRCAGTEFWINLGESGAKRGFPEWVPAMQSVVSKDDYDEMMTDIKSLFAQQAKPWYQALALCPCFPNFDNKFENRLQKHAERFPG